MRQIVLALLCAPCVLAASAAMAHPHVFAESRMEIVGAPDGKLASVRNIWRMDELFSSSVLFDFDKNANGTLDAEELAEVGAVVRESIAEWNYYTFVTAGGRDVKMQAPDEIRTLYENNQLIMFFEMKAGEEVDLRAQAVTFSAFDDSFFVAFDYADESAFQLLDMPADCAKAFTVPDPDAAAEEWMADISMLKPNETVPEDGIDYAQVLATRVDVKCG